MDEWLHLEIPERLVGETLEFGNDYIKSYRTEILLPEGSEFAGYYFLHPAKLVSCRTNIATLTYNQSFIFTLIKKEREPGKRYKRYSLSISDLIDIYSPETEKVQANLAKKELIRLAQSGTVLALECRSSDSYYIVFVFHYKKGYYLRNGEKFLFNDEIYKSSIVAESVTRQVFENAYKNLKDLCNDYRIIQELQYVLNRKVDCTSSDKTVSIYDSFYILSEQWKDEFLKNASIIIENKKLNYKEILS